MSGPQPEHPNIHPAGTRLRPIVTDMDDRRLRSLVATRIGRSAAEQALRLLQKLDGARVVAARDVPPSVVTMNSRVVCWSTSTNVEYELSLVYPWAGSGAGARISILSRLGVELLGASVGRIVVIDGAAWHLLAVVYQPEAARRFHL